jgi:glutathione S-transferase
VIELYQAEWCPASRCVRQRLTELGIDYVNRQVPVDRGERSTLVAATGVDSIPVLVLEDRRAVVGAENILAYLGEHYVEPATAAAHTEKAVKVRRRYLEEECA